jgi:hypothetical protein
MHDVPPIARVGRLLAAPAAQWFASIGAVLVALEVPEWAGFAAGTAIWLGCAVALTMFFRRRERPAASIRPAATAISVAVFLAIPMLWVLVAASTKALQGVFAGPPDVSRADMLVIINAALTRFLSGGYPYVHYQVPWDTPLTYGPMLWLPYAVPRWLHIDIRVLSLAAQLTVPVACGVSSLAEALRGRVTRAVSLAALAAAVALNPEILAFHSIGHTQVYWPLLLVLALLLADTRWTACCVVLGLLVNARATMGALVPVFFITLYARGELTPGRMAIFAASLLLPFAPFLVHDARGLIDSVVIHRLAVVKALVWHTSGATSVYGITGQLLQHGLDRYVEGVQAATLSVVYVAAWVRIRAGDRPEPWMVLALLVFCMTTVWSVLYIYFDVWLFATACLVAAAWPRRPRAWIRFGAAPLGALMLATCGVVLTAAHRPGSSYSIDVGTPAAAPLTGGGFGQDESVSEGRRTFVWVEGTGARVRLPRAGFTSATIRVTLRAYAPTAGLHQTAFVLLNGHVLGKAAISDTWGDITFAADRRVWAYGFNLLDLQFGYAVSARDVGTGRDERTLSVAIDRVTIE